MEVLDLKKEISDIEAEKSRIEKELNKLDRLDPFKIDFILDMNFGYTCLNHLISNHRQNLNAELERCEEYLKELHKKATIKN